jgi:hypothetical protein
VIELNNAWLLLHGGPMRNVTAFTTQKNKKQKRTKNKEQKTCFFQSMNRIHALFSVFSPSI